MPRLSIYSLGTKGVNVDADPINMKDDQLMTAENAMVDTLGANQGLSSRMGFGKFNGSAAGSAIEGAYGTLMANGIANTRLTFIGRGPNR